MNLATGLEVTPSTLYPAAPSPQAPPPAVTSTPGREVLAAGDLVRAVEGVPVRAVEDGLVRAALVRVLAVVVVDCWSQTWATTSQKSLRSIQRQHPRLNRLPPNFCPSNSNNNDGLVLKRKRRGCMRVLWLVLNRCKVSSRYLPLSRAHHFIRYVSSVVHDRTANPASARWTCRRRSNFSRSQRSTATLEYRRAREAAVV